MTEQTLKILSRIYESQDGKDFVEYIIKLKNNNYNEWKQSGGDVLRGKAICYDEIISLFESCNEKLVIRNNTSKIQEWL